MYPLVVPDRSHSPFVQDTPRTIQSPPPDDARAHAVQAEFRAAHQLSLLKEKTRGDNPYVEVAFKKLDRDRRGALGKSDFVGALVQLGLVLTHGQATTLASAHRGDYARFVKLCERRQTSQVLSTVALSTFYSSIGLDCSIVLVMSRDADIVARRYVCFCNVLVYCCTTPSPFVPAITPPYVTTSFWVCQHNRWLPFCCSNLNAGIFG